MFPRLVSSVLILAIIACPLWCGNGMCCAGQGCSVEHSADHVCPVHGTAKCCCEHKSPDNDDDNRGPCRCPNKSCQGVCGGAVFEKPVELDDAGDSLLLPLIEANASFALQLAETRSLDVVHRGHCHSGNHGRSLLTLHMSSLC